MAAALHNGDILIWCTFSGECEVIPGPPIQAIDAIKANEARASIFSTHPKPEKCASNRRQTTLS